MCQLCRTVLLFPSGTMPNEPDLKWSRELLSSTDPEESIAFTSEDREMLRNIFKLLKNLDMLDELKTEVGELRRSVDFVHTTMEKI